MLLCSLSSGCVHKRICVVVCECVYILGIFFVALSTGLQFQENLGKVFFIKSLFRPPLNTTFPNPSTLLIQTL